MSDEDQLTPADRELETALRSLRPVPVRIEPTVIGTRKRPESSRVRYWQEAVSKPPREGDRHNLLRRLRKLSQSPAALKLLQVAAAIAVAAGTAWMAYSLREPKPVVVEHSLPRTRPAIPRDTDSPMAPATLLAYRQALARSSDEFEALLDHQAGLGTMPQDTEAQRTMLTLRATQLQPSQGNM
jgi:hypothetical protein